jgi:DNA-binding transcriptional ArsR family regulator/intracellular sulfur oxidation DsrE/DsrF family protein
MKTLSVTPPNMHNRATETAQLLRALANTSRLLILCRLYTLGEASAGQLAQDLSLGLSALSQHLNRMREENLLGQRRHGRQLFYRISDSASGQLPMLLSSICGDVPMFPHDASTAAVKPPTVLAAVLSLAVNSPAEAPAEGFWQTPTIHDAGRMHAMPEAAYQPDTKATYKVVFGMTTGAAKLDQVHPALQRVARAVNLYVHAGVPLKQLQLVAIASGPATPMVLGDALYQKLHGVLNPNLPVIAQLRQAGVEVAVCGQALAEHGYPQDAIDAQVTLALSALTTVTELQRKGYALMPL